MNPKHRRSPWPRIWSVVLTLLSAAVVAGYLIAPGAWQWDHASANAEERGTTHEIAQVDIAPGAVDQQSVARLTNATASPQGSPVIITYHDIGYNPSKYTVTPENFAAQMRLFHDAGWTTLTTDQLDRWLDGEPMPPHSVLITFDDGARGVWQYADPVLKRYNQHAVAFIITGFVGTHAPYYMTWDEITELHASGRWDIEAHTHLGHVQVPKDDHGGQGPFLTTVQWLPAQHRLETLDEYRQRVLNDLTECKHQLTLHGLPAPEFLAYPFSAHEGDPEGTGILWQVVTSLYRAAMLDVSDRVATTGSSDVLYGNIQRMDVTSDLSLAQFTDRIEGASPLDPPVAHPLSDAAGWVDEKGRSAEVNTDGVAATINPDPGESVQRDYSPFRTSMWGDYTVSADITGLVGDGSHAGISVIKPNGGTNENGRVGRDGQVPHQADVTIDDHSYTVNIRGLVSTEPQLLPAAPAHHVVIDVTPTQVIVAVDDAPPTVIDIPPHAARTVGGGIALYAFRRTDVNPSLTFSNLTVS